LNYWSLFFFLSLLLSPSAHALKEPLSGWSLCSQNSQTQEPSFFVTEECDISGEWKKITKTFKSTKTIASVDFYFKDKRESGRVYNKKNELISDYEFSYPTAKRFQWLSYSVPPETRQLKDKIEMRGDPNKLNNAKILKWWRYISVQGIYQLKFWDIFNSNGKVKRRSVYKNSNLLETLWFTYKKSLTTQFLIKKIARTDMNTSLVGIYDLDGSLDLDQILTKQFQDPAELAEKMKLSHSSREVLAIIDSGVDIDNRDITFKMDRNSPSWMSWPQEKIESENPREFVYFKANAEAFSHGTYVASLATQDLNQTSITSFGGDYTQADYLNRISQSIQERNIRFVNLSFTFGLENSPFYPGQNNFKALKNLISNNGKSLFVIAAGNRSHDLDLNSNKQYPASFQFPNTLIVGALNTNTIEVSKLNTYLPSSFSNYGAFTVDIFAPGENISGSNLANGQVEKSGTSASAPIAMQAILHLREEFPQLEPFKLKEIILKSAYVKDPFQPLAAKSGGILFFKRAEAVAELYIKNPTINIENTVRAVRDNGLLGPEEIQNEKNWNKLIQIWLERGV
jgi:hypothetical protein